MKLKFLLEEFYVSNQIPANGGSDDKTFVVKFGFFNIPLPNPEFRRKVTYIHDIHHILNDCDTSWKGEGFIAGWEIATGIWKHFPVGILSLWAMGYSLWLHPIVVYHGFKKGGSQLGIIDLNYSKSLILNMDIQDLKGKLSKRNTSTSFKTVSSFLFWSIISQVILLSPLVLILLGAIIF